MRLLVVSHSYILADTRGKIRELAQYIDLTLLVPAQWSFDLVTAATEAEPNIRINLIASPAFFAGRNIRYLYSPRVIEHVLHQSKPEVVLVEEEPNSLALAQFGLSQKRLGFRLFFYTWENILWKPRFTHWVERFNFSSADGAIAGSHGAAEVLQQKGFMKRLAVIPQMGVDTRQFFPRRDPGPDSPFVIGYVGRMVEAKGLWTLFNALGRLDGEWELHLIGEGPLRTELQNFAEQAGWARHVRWIGFIPRGELPNRVQQMHTLVLPSHSTPHWKEQFGRVLIEAMACGVPVIGSNSGAIPEVIGDAGLIFPEDDATALADRLNSLMHNPTLRDQLSARGVGRVHTHYTDSVIAKQLYECLKASPC